MSESTQQNIDPENLGEDGVDDTTIILGPMSVGATLGTLAIILVSGATAVLPAVLMSRRLHIPGGYPWSPVYTRLGVAIGAFALSSFLLGLLRTVPRPLSENGSIKRRRSNRLLGPLYHFKPQILVGISGMLGMWISHVLYVFPLKKYEVLPYLREAFMALPIAGLVSAIWDVRYHKSRFGRYVIDVQQSVQALRTTVGSSDDTSHPNTLLEIVEHAKGHVDALTKRIDEMSNFMWMADYREKVQAAYRSAEQRILSVADYWIIDDKWWADGIWEQTPLYASLKENSSSALQITFAGRMPWPIYDSSVPYHLPNLGSKEPAPEKGGLLLKLKEADFQRLLGVAWRLEIAHRLRVEKAESRTDRIRVVIASVPVMATVVDDEVFMILYQEGKEDLSRGSKLLGRPGIADTFDDLINRYLRHSRSAREYFESLISLAALVSFERHINHAVNDHELKACLDTLGLQEWLDWHPDDQSLKPRYSRDQLEGRAFEAVRSFFHSYCSPRMDGSNAKFRSLVEDLL